MHSPLQLPARIRPVIPFRTLPITAKTAAAVTHIGVAWRQPTVFTFCAPLSTSRKSQAKNQTYSSIRSLDQFHTYQLLSASARTPLLTLWTASWCPTCKVVAPLLRESVGAGVGEAEGGVAYSEVEYDAPDVMAAGLGLTYMITSVPTLLSFDAQEAQVQTRVADGKLLADRRFLEEWIRTEARRHGGRGGGGGGGGGGGFSMFGGFFGGPK